MIGDVSDDEEKWLAEGIAGIQQNAFHMHRALIICTVKSHIMKGGPRRQTFTVPSLVFSALRIPLYFFERDNQQITGATIQGLIDLINTEMQSDSTTQDHASNVFFASTIRDIQFQKQKGGAMGEKYGSIKV